MSWNPLLMPYCAGLETRHEVLVVARPEMCGAGLEEPFDDLPAWIFGPALTQHRHLMSTHRGFFMPGDPGTRELPGNPGGGEIRKTPFPRETARVTKARQRTNSAVEDSVSGINKCDKFCCE